jgi:Alw26I/Eco31I/Esp3I family type II restriction m6 adenine DNA methyltransferase
VFVPRVVSDLTDAQSYEDVGRLYRHAVGLVVERLLSQGMPNTPGLFYTYRSFPQSIKELGQEIGPLAPGDVGEVYEYLRGFKIEYPSPRCPKMVPSVAGKRNQGLFYTPQAIVKYIVEQTLDALDVREPSHYLDVKILDPAVGTGRFLTEVLDRMTGRVLGALRGGDKLLLSRVNEISSRFQRTVNGHATGQGWDEEILIRIHILQECIYGVDLDPIAVNVARAVLLTRAFGQRPVIQGTEPHVRIGNALMGDGLEDPGGSSREIRDRRHAAAYFPKQPADDGRICTWAEKKRIFHWPVEFPEVFDRDRYGFDAVVGNPPYEILSAKESGIEERPQEQAYLRKMFRSCRGKLNTYRLMLERGLTLLRKDGVLGFVVPATLLADSTADKLRQMILDDTTVLKTVIIPEKARAFEGVAQALLILITRKSGRTGGIQSIFWTGEGPIPTRSRIEIPMALIERTDFRIPVIRKHADIKLLEAMLRHPPLGGNADFPPVGRVHQGEINLTIHRDFITARKTGYPLIRGEHIMPLRLEHPVPGRNRLDWMLPDFLESHASSDRVSRNRPIGVRLRPPGRLRGTPWNQDRIAIGRVVNMDTHRRLKAAIAPAGAFLGDMTNFIADVTVPANYLLGLLNSSVLNRRIKITSTNNYLSAAEIVALPIPRITDLAVPQHVSQFSTGQFRLLVAHPADSIQGWLERMVDLPERSTVYIPNLIELVVQAIRAESPSPVSERGRDIALWHLLDALVLKLYGLEEYAEII